MDNIKRKRKSSKITAILFLIVTIIALMAVLYIAFKYTNPVNGTIVSNQSDMLSSIDTSETESVVEDMSSKIIPESTVPEIYNGFKEFTQEEKQAIMTLISEAGDNVSLYFYDIKSGYSYSINDEYKYFIASLVKAPYCVYLYTLAEQGKLDLNEIYTIEFKDIQAGTGSIKDKKEEEFPLEITAGELMSLAIRKSDNTAVEALRKKYGDVGYLKFAKSIGIHYPNDVKNIVNGQICAKDAGVYLKACYNYIKNGKYGAKLKSDMQNTTNPMIRSKYQVVRKYGWAEKSFHDMAIVYAPSPYLLAICTDKSEGRKEDYKLLEDISKLIEGYQVKRHQ